MLDEATNSLDSLTEQELMATLLRLRGRYTIVLIAHRLNTLRACDVIFEIRNGQIANVSFLGVPVTAVLARGDDVWAAVGHGHFGAKMLGSIASVRRVTWPARKFSLKQFP